MSTTAWWSERNKKANKHTRTRGASFFPTETHCRRPVIWVTGVTHWPRPLPLRILCVICQEKTHTRSRDNDVRIRIYTTVLTRLYRAVETAPVHCVYTCARASRPFLFLLEALDSKVSSPVRIFLFLQLFPAVHSFRSAASVLSWGVHSSLVGCVPH